MQVYGSQVVALSLKRKGSMETMVKKMGLDVQNSYIWSERPVSRGGVREDLRETIELQCQFVHGFSPTQAKHINRKFSEKEI